MITTDDNKVCETCEGTGEVSQSGQVYPNEPYTADIDTAPCPDCNLKDVDDYNEEN